MSDTILPNDLSDLVPGNADDIEAIWRWTDDLNERAKGLGGALRQAMGADRMAPATRSILIGRVAQQAEYLADQLTPDILQGRVAEDVTKWVRPVLDEARKVALALARMARKGCLPLTEEIPELVARIRAPEGELQRIRDLLALAQATRQASTADKKPKQPKKKRRVTVDQANQEMTKAMETVPDRCAWSVREWANHVKCSTSTISKTEMWKQCEKARSRAKQDRQEPKKGKQRSRHHSQWK